MTKSQKQILQDLSFDGSAYATSKEAAHLLKAVGVNFFRVAKLMSSNEVVICTHKSWDTERGELHRKNEIKEFDLRHYGKVVFINQ